MQDEFEELPIICDEINSPEEFLQQFVFYNTYSRWSEENGRRETWEEAINRVITWMQSHIAKNYAKSYASIPWEDLRVGMLHKRVLPSMRIFQMAGPALDRCHVGAYNCFAGDERYVTKYGIKTFNETVGTTQEVLAADGKWRHAEVKQFGNAVVNSITFRPGSASKTQLRHTVCATSDHGWLTTRGKVRDLQVGDEVIANKQTIAPSYEEWVRGFLFGDGTVQDGCARVRLCGDKTKYLPMFMQTGCRVSYPPSCDGEPMVSWQRMTFADCKQLPTFPHPSWMEGYFAADGGKQAKQPTISTTRQDTVDYLIDHAAELGIVVTGHTVWTRDSNYGKRKPLHKLGIRPAETVTWRVMSIEQGDQVVPVYCVTEPVTHTFTLAKGLTSLNCAYLPLDEPNAIADLLYIMMQGTGVGFSVESRYVDKWPEFKLPMNTLADPYVIPDTTEGWCDAIKYAFSCLQDSLIPSFSYKQIRAKGSPLKTKGGYASGPEPLEELLSFIVNTCMSAAFEYRKLTTLEVHDIATRAGSIVEVGGTRRAAQLSLSDFNDPLMRTAKSGDWYKTAPWRSMANNSAVINSKLTYEDVFSEFGVMVASKGGERGLFDRFAAYAKATASGRESADFGTNPCGEILLRPRQFCNLSSVVLKPLDEFHGSNDVEEAIHLATIWGTLQSTLTNFQYISPEWKKNCEEERLLGVDMTGQADCAKFGYAPLHELRSAARIVNRIYANVLGINVSKSITTVKPSGNSSQLVNCSSGIHARYSEFYIRRVTLQADGPLHKWCVANKVPVKSFGNRLVVEIPIASPEGATTRKDLDLHQQLNRIYQMYHGWCDHNVSATVYVKPNDWLVVWNKIYKRLPEYFSRIPGEYDAVPDEEEEETDPEPDDDRNPNDPPYGVHVHSTGITFLPFDDHVYEGAPYEEITKERYAELCEAFPVNISFATLVSYDKQAQWQPTREWACTSDKCEII